MYAIYDNATGEIVAFTRKGNAPSGHTAKDVGPDMVDTKTHFFLNDELTQRTAAPEQVDPDWLAKQIRDEVKRRILRVASAATQMNMIGAKASGSLGVQDAIAFHAWEDWRDDTRAKGKQLITNMDGTYANDSHWPAVPANVTSLAADY